MKTNKMLGLFVAAVMILSSLGFVIGTFTPLNIEKRGICEGVIISFTNTVMLLPEDTTLREYDPLLEENLLKSGKIFWKDAEVNVNLDGRYMVLPALVFGDRNVFDRIVLQCDVSIRGGEVKRASLIEVLT